MCLCLAFCTGCPQPQQQRPGRLSAVAQQQANEVFNQAILTLNTLENHPCLPELPGLPPHRDSEILRQIVGRLDKWISNRAPDPLWKKDMTIAEMERALRECVGKVQKAAALMQRMQGRSPDEMAEGDMPDILRTLDSFLTEEERAMPLSEVRRRLPDLCNEISIDLQNLTPILRIPFERIAPNFAQIGTQIAALDRIGGLADEDIHAFSEQLRCKFDIRCFTTARACAAEFKIGF